jgi:hypothetical protein
MPLIFHFSERTCSTTINNKTSITATVRAVATEAITEAIAKNLQQIKRFRVLNNKKTRWKLRKLLPPRMAVQLDLPLHRIL